MYVKAAIPTLRYNDAKAAIHWLCDAFGFETLKVEPGPMDSISFSTLCLGDVAIIVSTASKEGDFDKYLVQPDEIQGRETQTSYIVVSDPDYFYERARTAGAEMLIDINDDPAGGRTFTCKDIEGHIWNFGSYDPWIDR